MTYQLDKKIWTDANFEEMGWHDATIYKIRLAKDLELDIDYILQWNQPEIENTPFTFWVAPATLVFKNVMNLEFEFDTLSEDSFEIADIERVQPNEWVIITQQGHIQFKSEGFEQFIRQQPSFQFGQSISYFERNGYSLERTTNQDNPNLTREDILEQKKKDAEHYENAKKRHLKRLELEQLTKAKNANKIGTKDYLLKKRKINELLFSYDFFLKGTRFENW
jgi:hypothetical protein